MSARWNKRRFCLCAGILLATAVLIACWTPARIQYHRSFVKASRSPHHERPARFRDYLSLRTMLWMIRGQPAAERIIEVGREHEEALIQMGYFDRRPYHCANMDRTEFVLTLRAGPLKDRLCFVRFGLDGSLEVVARRGDFARIEQIIERYGGHK
ncbi:MAG: hypothetical protein ACYDH9_04395 [Limisphaerales bacterium]